MLLYEPMSVWGSLITLGIEAIKTGVMVSPRIPGNENFREPNDLGSLCRGLFYQGNGLVDTSFKIIPHRFSLDGGDLELLTGIRHDEIDQRATMNDSGSEVSLTVDDLYCRRVVLSQAVFFYLYMSVQLR